MEWRTLDSKPLDSGFYFTIVDKGAKGVSYYDKKKDTWDVFIALFGNDNSKVTKWLYDPNNE